MLDHRLSEANRNPWGFTSMDHKALSWGLSNLSESGGFNRMEHSTDGRPTHHLFESPQRNKDHLIIISDDESDGDRAWEIARAELVDSVEGIKRLVEGIKERAPTTNSLGRQIVATETSTFPSLQTLPFSSTSSSLHVASICVSPSSIYHIIPESVPLSITPHHAFPLLPTTKASTYKVSDGLASFMWKEVSEEGVTNTELGFVDGERKLCDPRSMDGTVRARTSQHGDSSYAEPSRRSDSGAAPRTLRSSGSNSRAHPFWKPWPSGQRTLHRGLAGGAGRQYRRPCSSAPSYTRAGTSYSQRDQQPFRGRAQTRAGLSSCSVYRGHRSDLGGSGPTRKLPPPLPLICFTRRYSFLYLNRRKCLSNRSFKRMGT